MAELHCDRCGTLFDLRGTFMTVEVDVLGGQTQETLEQVLLCERCADAVGDALTLETTLHEHST